MTPTTLHTQPQINYPESDGLPMADNTVQLRWMTMIQGELETLFADRDDVFVAGNLLWYPIEGDNKTRVAPDVLVAFGRPKGDRGSYLQWVENGIAPQVVFEIVSPQSSVRDTIFKVSFYERHGVEEYYVYDPNSGEFAAYLRDAGRFEPVEITQRFTSPRLDITFDVTGDALRIYRPDGLLFQTRTEVAKQAMLAEKRADIAEERSAKLAAKLRELGIDPDQVW